MTDNVLAGGDGMAVELLSLKQASDFLQISEKSLIKPLAEQDVPARKLGNKWIFSNDALVHWVSKGSSKDYTRSGIAGDEELDSGD